MLANDDGGLNKDTFRTALAFFDQKAGYESIKNFDANGLMAPVTVTPNDHGGGGKTRVEQWNGTTWVPLTDWSADYLDVVWEVIEESSKTFSVE